MSLISTLSNLKKTLSMANSGPNTGGSQFFINLKDNIFLDFDDNPTTSAHPIFGIVISGWDTVEMIEAVPVNGSDRPITDVVMDSIRVTQYPVGIKSLYSEKTSSIIYPNPITSQSIIEIKGDVAGTSTISIYNQNGVLISSASAQITNGQNQIRFSNFGVEMLPKGIYYVLTSTDTEIIRNRFVVM